MGFHEERSKHEVILVNREEDFLNRKCFLQKYERNISFKVNVKVIRKRLQACVRRNRRHFDTYEKPPELQLHCFRCPT